MNYRENEVAALSARIVAFLSEDSADVEIKVAALRAAAATIDAAISAQTQLVLLQNMLSGSRR